MDDYLHKFGVLKVDFSNKDSIALYHMQNMFNRTQSMFEWKGLPDTIPQRVLELQIQLRGYTCITEKDGKLYATYGSLGGLLDYNYMPTLCIVANPYIPLQKSLKIGEECIIIPNDSLYIGLRPINSYYAYLLTENVISKRILTINSRASVMISAADNDRKVDAEEFYKDLEAGKGKVILSDDFLYEGIKSIPLQGTSADKRLTELIEDQQYIKASWLNEIGLSANYNMKREAINSSEAQLGQDSLLPLIDDMLNQRKKQCELVNKLFNVNWSVDLSSSWKALKKSIVNPESKESTDMDSKNSESTNMDSEEGDDNEDKNVE